MSPRKPTIDDSDDVDDEDGVLEEEAQEETDLSLDIVPADDAGLGGTAPEADSGAEEDVAEEER